MNNRKLSKLKERLGAIDVSYKSLLEESGLLDNEVDDGVTTNNDRLGAIDTAQNKVKKIYDTRKTLRREKKILTRMRRKREEQDNALANATQNCKGSKTKQEGKTHMVK